MERQPCGINRISKIRRISYKITKKLGRSHEVNRRSSKKHKETIWQEKKESSRIAGWRQCVACYGTLEH